ncbi:MAG: NAD(P)/FAD-dependent oxidoreductase [Micrococcales bacterium]|nr:NAD(P)/FAD-dependent oxidoreductase [Micrococcales bacterium]
MSADEQAVDIVVIGMGPGGEHVAGSLAAKGLRVLGVDHRLVGGECPYWGCIPSKMMVRAADALQEARRVPGLAGAIGRIEPDWSTVATRIRDEATDDWDDQVAVDRFVGQGGTFVRGTGRIAGPGRVEVAGQMYAAERGIVVNTGTAPSVPPIPGLDDVPYWTNREAVEAASLPRSLVVLGGGAIGCELSQAYARFGVEVTLVEGADRLLPLEEPEAGEILKAVLEAEGLRVHTGVTAEKAALDREPSGSGSGSGGDGVVDAGIAGAAGVAVTLRDGRVLRAERLLVATGRRADPGAAGLDVVGVDPDARAVPIDDRCRVTDGVWAIGDITGKGAFTHVSMYQASIVIRDILGEEGPAADYRALPRVTFTDPEVGAVGLTEAQARERLGGVEVGATPLGATARGWIHKAGNDGLIKVVADAERGVLVGATTMGPAGGEVLGALAVAVHAEVPIATLRSMMYAYPTLPRGSEDARGALG